MFNIQLFQSCIENKKNIKFITIDKDFFHKKKVSLFPSEDMTQINTLFEKIKTIVETIENEYIFIIFYEYFFGKIIFNFKDVNSIINNLKSKMKEIKNAFFFLPFLYENDRGPNNEELKDMLNYCKQVPVDYKKHPFVYWEVENNTSYDSKKTRWISNEVFVVYRDDIILTHKKGVYYKELIPELFNSFNYYYGIGKNRISTQDEVNMKIAEIIDKYFYIGICKEVRDEIDYMKYYFTKFDYSVLDDDLQKICEKKKKLFEDLKIPSFFEKKFFIIISNSTELYDVIHIFPNNSIIIQSDPKATQCFSVDYSKNLNYKLKVSKLKLLVEKEKDLFIMKDIIKSNIFNIVKNIDCSTIAISYNNTIINIFNIN